MQKFVIINHCNHLISIDLTVVLKHVTDLDASLFAPHLDSKERNSGLVASDGVQKKYEYLKFVTGTMLHFERIRLSSYLSLGIRKRNVH